MVRPSRSFFREREEKKEEGFFSFPEGEMVAASSFSKR